MATLTNEKIKLTYAGLIKTNDSGAIGAVAKPLTDGLGNAINMEVLTGQINFPSGVVDFTGSTVNGLPIQPAGLTAGTGTDSMKSADSLTTTAANASGTKSVAIGSDAQATGALGSTAVGDHARATGQFAAAFGRETIASATGAVALGNDANATQSNTIAIGYSARGTGSAAVAIGLNANASGTNSAAVGNGAQATAQNSVALGSGVIATTVDTVSVKALETQTASTPTAGGIIMKDAVSVARRINIDAAGVLQVDSTPVGGGPASFSTTTKVTATITGGDTLLHEITIPGNTFTAGDIIETFGMVSNDFTGGGTIYGNCFLAPVAGATGANGIQLASNSTSTSAGFSSKRTMIIHTANGTGDGTSTPGVDNANNANDYQTGLYTYPDNNTKAIDWTQTQYFKFYTWIDNAGSSSTLHGMYIKKVN